MPLVARYEQGLVHHAEHLPREFRDEVLSFTGKGSNGHDDFVDAASCAYHGIAMTSGKIALRWQERHRARASSNAWRRIQPSPPGSRLAQRRPEEAMPIEIGRKGEWPQVNPLLPVAIGKCGHCELVERLKAATSWSTRAGRLRAAAFQLLDGPARYCSSVTGSIHSTGVPLSASWIAMCVMIAVVGDAPCGCSCDWVGGQMTSPARIVHDRFAVACASNRSPR